MRIVLAALLIAGVLAPTAVADPQTCPTVCDRIPDTAWIATADIPLQATHRWPRLADVAVPTTGQPPTRFRFEELCAGPPPAPARGAAVSARADITPPGRWQLQARILHWRGDTWRGGQLASEVFDTAVAALRSCRAPGVSPSLTVTEPNRLAAVVAGPVLAHTYLVAHPQSSTLSELTLWSTAPPGTPWPVVDDAAVLDAMTAPLCAAYLNSCG